jgi:alkanesulfonate monooxygenase SsuD/methylene tetrahydromethanopterin reductase-like flavin-dependent oxidoreductase (luciferase family)
MVLGDPARVADKILAEHEYFRNDRFLLQMSLGVMPHARIMRAIELFGTRVAPQVRAALGRPEATARHPA